jgi:D-alanyl-D-alanine carboxypeptidase/D-alanyl-D-alanine-endopeptidase (penicillin-binding protein 4)
MNFWFLKKSVNLYGEAFVKTIGLQHSHFGSTDSGIAVIKRFWEKNGIEQSALKMTEVVCLLQSNRILWCRC